MTFIQKLNNWIVGVTLYKSDTPETIEKKVYLVRNGIIAASIISIAFILFPVFGVYRLLLLVSPVLLYIVLMIVLVIAIKRGIKWFLYFYYSGYIMLCSFIILKLGGLPNSMGIWGGSFIVFMHTLALKDRKILILTGIIYVTGLVIIGFSFPYLVPHKEWYPGFNNLGFTFNETWMCLFLVKSFYDSIVYRTSETKRRAIHLQELDVLKSKLYSNITHEFRTPLTLIRTNAEEIGDRHNGIIYQRANSIVLNADKILFLVNQMLNLSKIEEGCVPMHYVQTNLVTFLRFMTGSFQGYADMRRIQIHFEPQHEKLIMDIDAEKLEESISNLLSNAIKYTPEGGDVFVKLRFPDSGKITGQQVEISVRDTGIGIPEDQLDKIFIRFYRVDDNRYPYREGTGIGLTLVYEYLKLMKGSIQVKSRPGEGSEFIITLPVTNNAPMKETILGNNNFEQREKIIPAGSLSNLCLSGQPRLLIIEDNREIREYLTCLLGNDYQILSALNGIQGIKQVTSYIPDIILCDVMMPGKDGYQVCNTLKNDFRTSHIPIVMLTARADTESRIIGLELGADAYLTKPFNKKELTICLNNLLVQRETLRLKFNAADFNKTTEVKDAGLNGKFMSQVMLHLANNYKNDRYGIKNLCSDMGISRVQLHRKLTALTGHPASSFIRSFRLQKARRLLLETNKNVSDIAFDVGIADANYFSKIFIQEFGLPPTRLRESLREKIL